MSLLLLFIKRQRIVCYKCLLWISQKQIYYSVKYHVETVEVKYRKEGSGSNLDSGKIHREYMGSSSQWSDDP